MRAKYHLLLFTTIIVNAKFSCLYLYCCLLLLLLFSQTYLNLYNVIYQYVSRYVCVMFVCMYVCALFLRILNWVFLFSTWNSSLYKIFLYFFFFYFIYIFSKRMFFKRFLCFNNDCGVFLLKNFDKNVYGILCLFEHLIKWSNILNREKFYV